MAPSRRLLLLVLVLVATPQLAGCLGDGEVPRTVRSSTPDKPAVVRATAAGLTVDGAPFVVKGVVYAPIAPGSSPDGSGRWAWAGNPGVYEKDFRMLKAMGANAVRLPDPPRDCALLKRVLDRADVYDLKVMLGIPGPGGQDANFSEVRAAQRGEMKALVACAKAHPAVLAWVAGSGVDARYADGKALDDWYALLEAMARETRAADKNHPVATTHRRPESLGGLNQGAPSVALVGLDAYPGDPAAWGSLLRSANAALPGKALLVTEFGFDAWDSALGKEDGALQASLLTSHWQAIAALSRPGEGPAAGGFVFEWTDAWWRAGGPATHDTGVEGATDDGAGPPDGAFSGEWMGLARVGGESATSRSARPAYYALQALWADPQAPVPPSVVNVHAEVKAERARFTADVTTYGDAPVKVTLRYRVNSGAWVARPMVEQTNLTWAVSLGPYDGGAVVFYKVQATDAAGRSRTTDEAAVRVEGAATLMDALIRVPLRTAAALWEFLVSAAGPWLAVAPPGLAAAAPAPPGWPR